MHNSKTPTKILIVDDEPKVRAILSQHLSDGHWQCVTSQNAFDALNKIKHEQFSLVISDVMMPGMSGMELLRFLKRQDSTAAVVMITGVLDVATAVDCLRMGAYDYITKPFNLPAVRRAVERALEQRQLVMENLSYQHELEKKVRERAIELQGALGEVEESYQITLEALVTALDAREHETQAHSQRVREFTLTLARQFGIEGELLTQLGRGALLHDVGKIAVPDSILLKPGKLNEAEWVEMKKHPQTGYEILKGIQFLSPAAEIVLAHQERWDGKGYPNGLGERDIPLGARVFAVVDTMDAILSPRPYRNAMPFQAAADEILRFSGTQFDPQVVEAFLSIHGEVWLDIHEKVTRLHRSSDFKDILSTT